MQTKLDAIKTRNSIYNPINSPIHSKRRKLENLAKNKQIIQENPDLSATEKMSDGKNASIFH